MLTQAELDRLALLEREIRRLAKQVNNLSTYVTQAVIEKPTDKEGVA